MKQIDERAPEAQRIPEDIEAVAEKILMEIPLAHVDNKTWYALSRAIQEALVAEREGCALEPEIVAEAYEAYGAFETANEFRQVALAIRKGNRTGDESL